jgi:hypothetical protein
MAVTFKKMQLALISRENVAQETDEAHTRMRGAAFVSNDQSFINVRNVDFLFILCYKTENDVSNVTKLLAKLKA